MRLSPALRLTAVFLAIGLAGCGTSRPEPVRAPAPADRDEVAVSEAADDDVSRVGLAATMELPPNPFGDTAAVDLGDLSVIDGVDETLGAEASASGVDPNAVTVSRYYYDDESTYYYDDVEADLVDYGQGLDDEYYYGGYHANYYRYGDPAFFPSLYTYYRPYRVHRRFLSYGWFPTWRHRRAFNRARFAVVVDPFFYDPFFYDPFFYDPFFYDPFRFRTGVFVSFGFGRFGGYRQGFRDGFFTGFYGPGFYGRPRHRGYFGSFRSGGRAFSADDGDRGPVRGIPGTRSSPIAESATNPARQPARRGLAPARLPRVPADGGITR
ncbi:MAG: hypothetical protein AAF845_15925, partial [Bacteroidota bacterium]